MQTRSKTAVGWHCLTAIDIRDQLASLPALEPPRLPLKAFLSRRTFYEESRAIVAI